MNILGKRKPKALAWCAISIVLVSCSTDVKKSHPEITNVQSIKGETQGTTYAIKIVDAPTQIDKDDIDSLLRDFDLSLSGYIHESTVSQFNAEANQFVVPQNDKYFIPCLELSMRIFEETNGAFDPTVLPLMEIWGFLKDGKNIPSQNQIDSTLRFVGFQSGKLWRWNKEIAPLTLVKLHPNLQFDFNAIAQGYSVDVIGSYLRQKGCLNFYVEIGGEIYVSGKNPDGKAWRLGVDKPVSTNIGDKKRVISAILEVQDRGVATSGNYRKFYEKNGKIYAHTLNPKTGKPAENELLSATVIGPSVGAADGVATAIMVMGLEKAKAFLRKYPEYDALLIYTDAKNELFSFSTAGMEKYLK